MDNVLTRKLQLFGKLPEADRIVLNQIIGPPVEVEPGESLIHEGDKPDNVHLILRGLACRNQILPDGKRQITAFLLPGDFCDLHIFILSAMDHNISTLGRTIFAEINRAKILQLLKRPSIARALWWATLVDEATLRAAVVNVGRRPAVQRIAHLFCELHLRLRVMGSVKDGRFDLPVTQTVIADAVGITHVHANRSIQLLRRKQLLYFESGSISIPDIARLRAFAGFDAGYLHLEGGKLDSADETAGIIG